MSIPDEELDRFIGAMAAIIALPIEEECRPGVRQFVRVAAEMAAMLDAAELDPDELALASVYQPPTLSDERQLS